MTAVLRRAGKVAAGIAPAALMARLGLPALGALVFLVVLAAGVTCWLLGSDAGAARVSRVLLAWRGDPGCLAAGGAAASAAPLALAAVPVTGFSGYCILAPME